MSLRAGFSPRAVVWRPCFGALIMDLCGCAQHVCVARTITIVTLVLFIADDTRCERMTKNEHCRILLFVFVTRSHCKYSPVAQPQIFGEPCNTIRTKFFAVSIRSKMWSLASEWCHSVIIGQSPQHANWGRHYGKSFFRQYLSHYAWYQNNNGVYKVTSTRRKQISSDVKLKVQPNSNWQEQNISEFLLRQHLQKCF